MSRRSRAGLLTATALAAVLALLGLPGSASASGTTKVLVAVDDCSAQHAGTVRCYARHLEAKRVAAAKAGRYLRKADHHVGSGPAGGFSPAEVATAYGVDPAGTAAADQVVAVVDAFHAPDAPADLDVFDGANALPSETGDSLRVIGQDGSTTLPTDTDDGWAGETDLDLQAVRGLCNACKILLVEADSDSLDDIAAAVDAAAAYSWAPTGGGAALGVGVISNSYGGAESKGLVKAYASAYKHLGKVITVSTGDDGWFGWDFVNEGEYPDTAPSFPASLSTVVGVGGTTLDVDPTTGARTSETTWNENGDSDATGLNDLTASDYGTREGAAGSGCSSIVKAQKFQYAAKGYSSVCASKKRSTVDVAALADPYTGYDVYTDGGWATYGGTSLSSPLVAAMWALAGGPGVVDYPAKNLYRHFALKKDRGLYDLKVGGGGLCGLASTKACAKYLGGDPNKVFVRKGSLPLDCQFAWKGHKKGSAKYQCRARAGYDGVSGVGTPAGLTAFTP